MNKYCKSRDSIIASLNLDSNALQNGEDLLNEFLTRPTSQEPLVKVNHFEQGLFYLNVGN